MLDTRTFLQRESLMKRRMHINVFVLGYGHHEAAWRHPGASELELSDVRYYQDVARRAEAGLLDSLFFADIVAIDPDVSRTGQVWLEPITTLAALAVSTSRIGLIGTASTTFTEPYNLARQLASLDHISGGRAAWNVVTTWSVPANRNYSRTSQESHSDRYDRADEYMHVVTRLWDSWADDAVVRDRQAGVYARADRIRPIDHAGRGYQVAGPLNLPRSPQGRPVIVQAGSSDTGRGFAARHAEAVFTAHMEKSTAQAFYADLKARVATCGRPASGTLVLPGISPVIAGTEAEARRLARELDDLTDPEVGRKRLSGRFGGHDFSHLPLDKPLRPEDFPRPDEVQAARSRTEVIIGLVRREQPTLRQLLASLAGARGHFRIAGTPEQVADLMQDWFQDGAADGFNLMPPVLPSMLDAFVSEVVPVLQRRGLFRTAYEGRTLREHYGLSRPAAR